MKRKIVQALIALTLFNFASPVYAGSYGFGTKAEDAASASGDSLLPVAAVRKDGNDTALTSTDGDYTVLSTNDVGNLKVQVEPTRKTTYTVWTGAFTCASSATDVWQLYAGSNKIVKVLKVWYVDYDTGSSAANNNVSLIKRSTANSSGTPVTNTIVPMDSSFAAADAVSKHYTANPSLGTTVGTVAQAPCSGSLQTPYTYYQSLNSGTKTLFDADKYGAPIVLRGTSQGITINLNGATQAGASPKFAVGCVWTEE